MARALAVFSLNITLVMHTSLTWFTLCIDTALSCVCLCVCIYDSWKADTEHTDGENDPIENRAMRRAILRKQAAIYNSQYVASGSQLKVQFFLKNMRFSVVTDLFFLTEEWCFTLLRGCDQCV